MLENQDQKTRKLDRIFLTNILFLRGVVRQRQVVCLFIILDIEDLIHNGWGVVNGVCCGVTDGGSQGSSILHLVYSSYCDVILSIYKPT